jgi:hypothetical protein
MLDRGSAVLSAAWKQKIVRLTVLSASALMLWWNASVVAVFLVSSATEKKHWLIEDPRTWTVLDFFHHTRLTTEHAEVLVKKNDGRRVNLNRLTTLSDEAARALAQHEGWLSLNGLTTLSDEAAKALAQHQGALHLNGLATLSVEVARALAQHKGRLSLDGLTTLSDEAAQALAQHKGVLFLEGLTTLSDEQAKALAQHQGLLSLNGLTTLSDQAAAALRANPEIRLPRKFEP